ncbi:hypothetical protein HPG69_016029, partial [Diceros bicornis minor]
NARRLGDAETLSTVALLCGLFRAFLQPRLAQSGIDKREVSSGCAHTSIDLPPCPQHFSFFSKEEVACSSLVRRLRLPDAGASCISLLHGKVASVPAAAVKSCPMAFNDLPQQVGGMGRFQKIQFTLLVLPLFLIYLHSTLQNFTAAIPTHHCCPPADANLSKVGELEAWLPLDRQGQPKSCLRFTFPQRRPPFPNGTEANDTEP